MALVIKDSMEFQEVRGRLSIRELLYTFWSSIFFCQHIFQCVIRLCNTRPCLFFREDNSNEVHLVTIGETCNTDSATFRCRKFPL